jgi:hypothetical protein
MKKYVFVLLIILLFARYLPLAGQATSKDAFHVLVYNASTFDLRVISRCDKNEGAFLANVTMLGAGKKFLFRIMKTPGGAFPRGVEGTITFSTMNPDFPGTGQVHFNDPVVGSSEFEVTASNWPITIQKENYRDMDFAFVGYLLNPNGIAKITVDTSRTRLGNINPPTLTGNIHSTPSGSNTPGNNTPGSMVEPIPPVINFDWKVSQRMRKDDDDDNDGKAYKTATYLFTSNGDYAAIKPDDDASFSLMIYSKKGQTWIMDDDKKTITVMNMPRTVGEGAVMGKAIAEDIKKSSLEKDRDDEKFTITRTGKTKQYLGYTAEEFELKNNSIKTSKNASKTGTASFWYAKVPFDPVKVYTMGVGRPADISKLQNDPRMKNNITAIPMLNKNFLWVETESGSIKGMEVTEIKNVNTTINTSGYHVKVKNSLKDMMKKR